MHKLLPRQRNRDDDDDDDQPPRGRQSVQTVISVVLKTMPKTFTGEAKLVTQSLPPGVTLIDPAVRTTPTARTTKTKEESSKPTETRKPTSASAKTSEIISEITSIPTNVQDAGSIIAVATESPVQTGALAASGIATAAPTAAAAASAGMSGGAKAGLALGVLAGVGALLAIILLIYHRKKKQIREKKLDDEKTAMRELPPPPPPVIQSAPSIRSQRTMSTAPRLSLRPVTQFSPTFAENRKSGGNLLNVTSAAAVPRQSPSPDRPSSSWERPGASNAAVSSPIDPFSDRQARSPSPPQNPFTNSAAIDNHHGSMPGTPHTANDLVRDPGMNGFPSPAPVIAAAPVHRPLPSFNEKDLPPPGFNDNNSVPPSPAWTDDIPESPGPAPTGPPPVAVPNNVHRVQMDFRPSMQDELELHAGQLVRMLHEYDDGWALCVRMDRTKQGVVPRTCVSKHPVKPRNGPPRQPPPGQRPRGPPINSQMGPGGVPQPRPLTPSSGRNSPHPPSLSPANGRMSPAPGPDPRSVSPPQQFQDQSRARSNSNAPSAPYAAHPRSLSPGPQNMPPPQNRARSNSNAPYAQPQRSMSPGPYGGGPQSHLPPPEMGRPRSNSAGQLPARKAGPAGPSPMNPNQGSMIPVPARKPVPGLAL